MIKYEQEKMVFGVFPLLGHRRKLPKHRYPKETLETCLQWMEVSISSLGIGLARVPQQAEHPSRILLCSFMDTLMRIQALAYLHSNLVAHLVGPVQRYSLVDFRR